MKRSGDERCRRIGLTAGGLAGPLFLTTALVEGTRRPGYQPTRHPISSLAIGPRGWLQVANFLTAGAMYGCFAVSLARDPRCTYPRALPALVGTAGIGLLGAGLFRTDPVSGYPPGTPDQSAPTAVGIVHNVAAVPLVVGVSGAALLESWGLRRPGSRIWSTYSVLSGLLAPAAFAAASAGFAQQPALVERAGSLQRIFVGIGFGWVTAFAVRCGQLFWFNSEQGLKG